MRLIRTILCSALLCSSVATFGQNSDSKWKSLLESIEYLRQTESYDEYGDPYEYGGEEINGEIREIEWSENNVNPGNGMPVSGGPNGRNAKPNKGLYRDFRYTPDQDFEGWEPIDEDKVYNDSEYDDTRDDIRERWDKERNSDSKSGKNNRNNSRAVTEKKPEPKSDEEIEKEKEDAKSNSNWLTILGIILLAILIAFILYRVYTNRQPGGNQKIDLNESDDMSPEEISKTELELALEKAIKNGDYRAAVRVYFIFIMKDLVEKGWIEWEKEKTNLAYLREMMGRDEYNDFNQCVTIFEIVWYGKRDINESEFDALKGHFKKLLDKLGVK